MKDIEQTLDFIVEVEKLKAVERKTKPVGLDRYENSAEHSWHVCLSALMLKEYANENINIDRVIKMLLLHDLGEIDAGDTIVYESDTQDIKKKEQRGFERIIKLLPKTQQDIYMQLWLEFEEGATVDAQYAKSIDRIPPLLHNLHGDGHSWNKYNISQEKIFSVNSRIEKGSVKIWQVIKEKLTKAFSAGILK